MCVREGTDGEKGASEVTFTQPAGLLPGASETPPISQLLREEEEGGSPRQSGGWGRRPTTP